MILKEIFNAFTEQLFLFYHQSINRLTLFSNTGKQLDSLNFI